MENNIKKWIMDYGVIGRRRFYRKEKIRYIQRIEREFHQMGYATSILSPKGSKGKAINLLIGDVKHADTIVIANYDTPVKSFGLYTYKPFDLHHRNTWFMIITLIPLLIIAGICFVYSAFYLKIEWLKGIFHWRDVWALFIYLIGIIMIVHYAKGIPNGRNLNRNSSGVVALLKATSDLSAQKRTHTAFVLTDFGCMNHLGDQMLKAYLKSYDSQKFILLDTICDPHEVAVCYSKDFTADVKRLHPSILRCPMNQANFNIAQLYPNTLVISSGIMKNNAFLCENVNTRNDIQIDIDRICFITEQLLQLIS